MYDYCGALTDTNALWQPSTSQLPTLKICEKRVFHRPWYWSSFFHGKSWVSLGGLLQVLKFMIT